MNSLRSDIHVMRLGVCLESLNIVGGGSFITSCKWRPMVECSGGFRTFGELGGPAPPPPLPRYSLRLCINYRYSDLSGGGGPCAHLAPPLSATDGEYRNNKLRVTCQLMVFYTACKRYGCKRRNSNCHRKCACIRLQTLTCIKVVTSLLRS